MKHFACVLFCLLLLPFVADANERAQGYCTQGGQVVVINPGLSSTTKVMQSYPTCTVTVYVSGTLTLATIYSDNSNTPLSNPFSANSVGLWFFYAGNGRYDVKLSGGGIPSPFTLGDILLLDAAAGGGIVSSVAGGTGISVSPTSGAVVVTNTWGTPIPTQTAFPSPFPTVTNRNNNSYWLGTRFQYNNGTGYDFHGQPDPAGAMVVDLVVPSSASDSAIAGAAIIGRGVTFGSTGAVGVQGLGFVAVNGGSGWGGVSYVQPDITGSYGSSFHATINGMIGFGHEADCNMFADGSGNAQGQCIPFWAAGSSDLQTTGDSAAFANGALGGVKTGNLSTNGTAVTRISGAWFDAAWPTQNSKIVLCPSSTPCTSGGTTYTISTVNSVSSLTLGSSAGVNANLAYYVGSLLPYDYGYRSYNGRANIGIRLGTLHNNSSTDLGGYTGVWPTDQSQPLYFDNLNSNVAQTTALSTSGGGVFQVNSPNGVQFITNAAKQGFFFDVQDGIGITGDPNTAQTVESRYIAAGFSGNSYDGRITVKGGTNGTNGAGTLTVDANTVVSNGVFGLDARRYGVKCDNSTNDASALNTAITAASAIQSALLLPSGICIISPDTVTVPANVTLQGQGVDQTYIKPSGNGTTVLTISASNGAAAIRNMTLDATGKTITNVLEMDTTQGSVIENVKILAGTNGLTYGANAKFTHLNHLTFGTSTTACISSATNTSAENYIEDTTANCGSGAVGLSISRTTSSDIGAWYLRRVTMSSMTNGISFSSTQANTFLGLFCHQCILDAESGDAATFTNASTVSFDQSWFATTGNPAHSITFSGGSQLYVYDSVSMSATHGSAINLPGSPSVTQAYGNNVSAVNGLFNMASGQPLLVSYGGNNLLSGTIPVVTSGQESTFSGATQVSAFGPAQFATCPSGNSSCVVDIYDSTNKNHKYFRNNNGTLEMVNNAFGAVVTKIADDGHPTFGGCNIFQGTGSPNSAVTGSPCDLYVNKSGGSSTTLYVKESGSGTNTGWVGK